MALNPVGIELPTASDTEAEGVQKLIDALHNIEAGINAVAQALTPVVIDPNLPPVPAIAVTGKSDLAVSFSGAGSSDPDSMIASYRWAYGDGSYGNGLLVSHTYAAAGTYTVTLTVTDTEGLAVSTTTSVAVTVSAPVVNPPAGTEPTGPGIISYRSLSGANPSARLASVTAGQKVSLPPQVISWNDFAQSVNSAVPNNSGSGLFIQRPGQLLGSGIGNTVLRMNAGSTSKRTQVGGTTKLEYIHLLGSTKLVQDLTVQGVPINEGSYTGASGKQITTSDVTTQNVYNGFFINTIDGFVMKRVKVSAIPGSYQAPPGETFGIDVYRGNSHTYEDIEIDGQNTVATGWGPNFLGGTTVVNRLNAHDCRYSSGAAIFACTGTIVMTDCVFRRNYNAINFEDCGYTSAKVIRPIFEASKTSDINWWGDTTTQSLTKSFRLDIYDPVVVGGGKIRVRHTATHGGYPNVMQRSDIHVWVNGVEQLQSNAIQFV